MKRTVNHLLATLIVFALTASCVSVVFSQESSEKAKQILEKTYQKYSNLLKKDGKGLNSIAAKVSINGGGSMPTGGSGSMPLDIDMIVELYAARPHHLYLGISGNLGNATIAVTGKEKVTATIILPSTKQFAVVDVPEKTIQEMQEDDPQKPDKMEEFWEDVILAYDGVQDTKIGKAHKITVKPKDPSEKQAATVYILDDKWDPARIEVNAPEEGAKLVMEIEKLDLNINIPGERFVLGTEGYTQVTSQQLTSVIMMQIMGAMMQKQEE